ncbi:hypothetical protein NA57DRAFT_78860 [Rhizodiscina lignyota]|uniref:Uncharacterized protein n=1 Tax=Rhizodiscina lignyota TaxID=1504668 RepID=A0A9P4M3U5_9PEZI|nr:hypothetical protein NA57DRAFT_78860 [Rhizodiscina lignyota]
MASVPRERDANSSPARDVSHGSPPMSGSSTPTRYSIDLSVLARPPNNQNKTYSPSRAFTSRPYRARKPSRAMSTSSLPLPSSPPRDKISSDDVDGPEDFTINMSYWMRCKLSNALDGTAEAPSKEREVDRTLDEGVLGWMARGNERLIDIQRRRSVDQRYDEDAPRQEEIVPQPIVQEESTADSANPNDSRPHTPMPVEERHGENEERKEAPRQEDVVHSLSSATIEQQEQALSYLSDDEDPKAPEPDASNIAGATSILVSSGAPEGSPHSTRKPPPVPRHATVEEYFSTPAKPDPFAPLIEKAALEYRTAHDHGAEHPVLNDAAQEFHSGPQLRIATLEAEVASLTQQLQHSRLEIREAVKSSPKAYAADPSASEAEARNKLESANRHIQDLTTQLMKREREWLDKLHAADVEHVSEQQRLRTNLEAQLHEIQARLDRTEEHLDSVSSGGRSPAQENERRKIPKIEFENELRRLKESQDAHITATNAQIQQRRNNPSATPRPTPPNRGDSAGLSTATHSVHGHIKSFSLNDVHPPASPTAQPYHDPAVATSNFDGPLSQPSSSNDPYINRKLAQILGVPFLPPAFHLDRLVRARETKIRDFETKLEEVCKEKAELQTQYETDKNVWDIEVARLKDELKLVRSESDARAEYLRTQLQEREEDAVEARLRLASARRDAESASERLRVVTEEHREEVITLKTKLAEAEGWKGELIRQVDEQRSQILKMEGDVMKLKGEKRKWDADAREQRAQNEAVLEDVRGRAEEAVRKAGVLLDKEKNGRVSAERELGEVREDMHNVREQLRSLSVDGASDRRDSGFSEPTFESSQKEATFEAEIKSLREALQKQTRDADTARAETAAANDELRLLREDMVAINEAMDARIAKMMKKREQEWASKFDALSKERSRISKALMQSWGEIEVGESVPQEYRYRYV